jgi:hypothetical protein
MSKHTFPNIEDTATLWIGSTDSCPNFLSLNISYKTDSVYLYKESFAKDGTMIPVLEFTSNCKVLDIRDINQVRCIGRIRTPAGVRFGSELMFESTELENGRAVFTVHYDKPDPQMFINFEQRICQMLCQDNCDALDEFLDQDWKKLKARNSSGGLQSKDLIIRFN